MTAHKALPFVMSETSSKSTDIGDKILLGTVGEFRMLGLRVPPMKDDPPDDSYITLPIPEAANLAKKILEKWELTPTQQAGVLKGNDPQRITDILKIEMYLDVLFPKNDNLDWLVSTNRAFSDMKTIDYILQYGTKDVVSYLSVHVYGGG